MLTLNLDTVGYKMHTATSKKGQKEATSYVPVSLPPSFPKVSVGLRFLRRLTRGLYVLSFATKRTFSLF